MKKELDILLVTRGGDLMNWLNHHISQVRNAGFKDFKILIASEGPISLNPEYSKFIRITQLKSSPYERMTCLLDESNSDFIMVCADDDYWFNLDREELLMLDQSFIGLSPIVYFNVQNAFKRKKPTEYKVANTSQRNFDSETRKDRLQGFLSRPMPGDNSLYYSIFRSEIYKKCWKNLGDFLGFELIGADWAVTAQLLSHGGLKRCFKTMLIRDLTPMSETLGVSNRILLNLDPETISALPLLPTTTFIRDVILNREEKTTISHSLLDWNLFRYSQLKSAGLCAKDLSKSDINQLFFELHWGLNEMKLELKYR